jgi:hypothetical protein
MNELSQALTRAARGLLHPRMLLLMVWPLAVSLILWVVLGALFGAQVFNAAETYLHQSSLYRSLTTTWPLSALATGLLWLLMFLVAIPLVLVTSTLIIGLVAMPLVVRHVAQREYPMLELRGGGSIAGSVVNALVALAWLIVLALLSLPLWFIPILWPVMPIVLLAFFNQRVFRYDALADHASAEEMKGVIRSSTGKLWGLGIVVGAIASIPIVGFFAPVFSALAFTYYCLERLARQRGGTLATNL